MTDFIRVRSAEGPTDEYFVSAEQLAATPDDYDVINPSDAPVAEAPAVEATPEPSVGESNEEGGA